MRRICFESHIGILSSNPFSSVLFYKIFLKYQISIPRMIVGSRNKK